MQNFDISKTESGLHVEGFPDAAAIGVSSQADDLCDALTRELEAEPYEKLIAREPARYRIPMIGDMRKRRR